MSILNFVCLICNCFNGELPCSVPTATINELSWQVQEVQKSGMNCGHYSKFSAKEKALVGKYASLHRVLKAVRYFRIGKYRGIGETFILNSCVIKLS